MAFEELQDNLEILFSNHNLDHFDLQNVTHRESFFYGLNTSQYYATLHDLQRLKPLYINDKMKEFYGFQHNTFSDIDYFYYFLTIHPTSYGVLLDSIVHFKKGGVLSCKFIAVKRGVAIKSGEIHHFISNVTHIYSSSNSFKQIFRVIKEVINTSPFSVLRNLYIKLVNIFWKSTSISKPEDICQSSVLKSQITI